MVNHAGLILICVFVVMSIKVSMVALGMRTLGFSRKAAILGGLSLAQISELSLFLVARAHEYRLISRKVYLLVVATTIVLLVLTPLSSHAFRGMDRSEYKVSSVTKSPFARWWHGHGGGGGSGSHQHPHHHHAGIVVQRNSSVGGGVEMRPSRGTYDGIISEAA